MWNSEKNTSILYLFPPRKNYQNQRKNDGLTEKLQLKLQFLREFAQSIAENESFRSYWYLPTTPSKVMNTVPWTRSLPVATGKEEALCACRCAGSLKDLARLCMPGSSVIFPMLRHLRPLAAGASVSPNLKISNLTKSSICSIFRRLQDMHNVSPIQTKMVCSLFLFCLRG